MSFFNNPEYNSVKVLLVVLIVAGAGYFAFNDIHSNQANTGMVANLTAKNTMPVTPPPEEVNCYGVTDRGSGSCDVSPADCYAPTVHGAWQTCHSKSGDTSCCCTLGSKPDCYDSDGSAVVGGPTGLPGTVSSSAAAKYLVQKGVPISAKVVPNAAPAAQVGVTAGGGTTK